jgi:hypothetical protein
MGNLFGIFILFILPSKLVTTVFSGFLGIGASQRSTADGLITKADKSITKIVYQVTSIVGGQTHGMEDFIKSMTLIFFVILIVLCLPAFNRD